MDGCIDWTKAINSAGYGSTWFRGKSWVAHRVAWTKQRGEIPEGMCVCHHCDNRRCVNVDHMFLGTVADNNADKEAKGRGVVARGEASAQAKLTNTAVQEIRASSEPQRILAERFGVSKTLISYVQNRKAWRAAP